MYTVPSFLATHDTIVPSADRFLLIVPDIDLNGNSNWYLIALPPD